MRPKLLPGNTRPSTMQISMSRTGKMVPPSSTKLIYPSQDRATACLAWVESILRHSEIPSTFLPPAAIPVPIVDRLCNSHAHPIVKHRLPTWFDEPKIVNYDIASARNFRIEGIQ